MKKTLISALAAISLAGIALVGLSSAASAAETVVPLPANPLVGSCIDLASFVAPPATGVVWSAVVDHKDLNGKVGVSATPAPGFQFANGVASKAYAATQQCP